MARQSKQQNPDGYQAPSRFSHEGTPDQARKARKDEGSRWVHMDADDATWARTPEERAWRELNADTRAERVTSNEDDAPSSAVSDKSNSTKSSGESSSHLAPSIFTLGAESQAVIQERPFSHDYPESAGQTHNSYHGDPYYYYNYTLVYDHHLQDDLYYFDEYNYHLYYGRDDYYPHLFYPQEYTPAAYSAPAYTSYNTPEYSSSYHYPASYSEPYYSYAPTQPYESAATAVVSAGAVVYVAEQLREYDYAQQADANRLTVNQVEGDYAQLGVNQADDLANRLTVNRVDNYPVSDIGDYEPFAAAYTGTVAERTFAQEASSASLVGGSEQLRTIAPTREWVDDLQNRLTVYQVEDLQTQNRLTINQVDDQANRLTVNRFDQMGDIQNRLTVNQVGDYPDSYTSGYGAMPAASSAAASFIATELPKDDVALASAYVMSQQAVQTQEDAVSSFLSAGHAALFSQHPQEAPAAPSIAYSAAEPAYINSIHGMDTGTPYQAGNLLSESRISESGALLSESQTLASQPYGIYDSMSAETSAAAWHMLASQPYSEAPVAQSLLSDSAGSSLSNVKSTSEGRSDYLHVAAAGVIAPPETPYTSFIDSERCMDSVAQAATWMPEAVAANAVLRSESERLVADQADDLQKRLTVNQVEDVQNRLTINQVEDLQAQNRLTVNQVDDQTNRLTVNRFEGNSGVYTPVSPYGNADQTLAQDESLLASQVLAAGAYASLLQENRTAVSWQENGNLPYSPIGFAGQEQEGFSATEQLLVNYSVGEHASSFLRPDADEFYRSSAQELGADANRLTVNQVGSDYAQLGVNEADDLAKRLTVNQVDGLEHPYTFVTSSEAAAHHALAGQLDGPAGLTSSGEAGLAPAREWADDLQKRLTVNQVEQIDDVHNRLTVNQVDDLDIPNTIAVKQVTLTQDEVPVAQVDDVRAQVAVNRDVREWLAAADKKNVDELYVGTAKVGETSAEVFLVTSPSKHQKAESFILPEENLIKKQAAAQQLANAPSVEKLLRDKAAQDGGTDLFDPGAKGSSPQDDVAGGTQASTDTKAARLGLKSQARKDAAKSELKAAGIGLSALAGGMLLTGAKTTAGSLGAIFDRALREDEDLVRVADTEEVLKDAVTHMRKHAPDPVDNLILSSAQEQRLMREGKAADKLGAAKKAGIRETPSAVAAEELAENIKAKQLLEDKPVLLEERSAGVRSKALEAGGTEGAEQFLTPAENGLREVKGKGSEKGSVKNRFEKKLAAKRQERLAKRDAKSDKKALETLKHPGAKAALLAEGAVLSGAKKVLSKENEEIAVAMSMVDNARKVKSAARVPQRAFQWGRSLGTSIAHALRGLWHTVVATVSSGPAGLLAVIVVFLLFVFLIIALIGSASIINDEQEMSEVSALVAELDEDLTQEIQALGSSGVLYCDARGTYGEESGGKSLTKNVDLSDDKSDLKEVTASTITVQTDPAEVVAYIDAKYTGRWQVGAASWKYTADVFGEKWVIIEWGNMPEWCWKALNKINRQDFKTTLSWRLQQLLIHEHKVDDALAKEIGDAAADEFATVLFDNQVQDINEEILTQIIEDTVKAYKSDLELSKNQVKKLYYQMQETIAEMIGEEDPYAFVYDEIVALHADMNWWSEEYQSFGAAGGAGAPAGSEPISSASESGTYNKYNYPNSSGYSAEELEKWDGYNEVSVYGISEAGTTSVTADGTRITNTWSDTNMAIACEGLQNNIFAYWTRAYKEATGTDGSTPVKITMYNPSTGKTVTAEVRDCGGWRGFNKKYAGLNADRQWDLLPAVWKALGGTPTSGLMHVYWKVDPNAVVGSAGSYEPIEFKGYPWPKESDSGNGTITLNCPTLVVHSIIDALNNDPLMDKIIGKDDFATEAEFQAVKSFTVTKVRGIMKSLLTMKNDEGGLYTDYTYFRRNLGSPFGSEKNGDARQWVVTKRFNPGYDDFDKDECEVTIKPLGDVMKVYTIKKGEVQKVKDGKVTIRTKIDEANSVEVTYAKLTGIAVEKGDEVKRGQYLGKMSGKTLKVSYYEVKDLNLLPDFRKSWAYDPALFMLGFAGYVEPDAPEAYTGGSAKRDYSDCTTIVEFAQSRLGCPYVFGATGPDTFDCSGLTQWCYAHAGISIPRSSEEQHNAAAAKGNCHPINLSDMQPGDIVWKKGHVGIYIGNNQYIHAPQTGDVVKVSSNVGALFTHYLRFT